MKGILIAGVFAAFAITVIGERSPLLDKHPCSCVLVVDFYSLECRQCQSLNNSCSIQVVTCEEGSLSCVESSVNSTLGGSLYSYQNKFCSKSNCTKNETTQVAFTVHVFDDQSYHFASQCCQDGQCSISQTVTNTQCSACYSYNTTTCQEKTRQCFEGEQCVHIIAVQVNDTEHMLELKGCSDISQSVCETLAPENTTFGEFIFQKVQCTNATKISSTTTLAATTTTSTAIKASFASSVFGSLLLLKLLF
uniref:LY6/PLAUR domain containing 8 n=1 Tax=Cricetulus griseus TaxID=10029 RepID=A0A8C2LWD9_CRIGR